MKHLPALLALCICTFAANAATDEAATIDSLQNVINDMHEEAELQQMYNKTWGKGRFTRLGYSWSNSTGNGITEDGKFSFFLTKGTTYYFPKTPIAKMLKIGVDAVWFDAQVTKYKSIASAGSAVSSVLDGIDGVDEEIKDQAGEVFDEVTDEVGFDPNKIGTWGLSLAMGIGPNVSIAPFALTDIKIMQPLRLSVYFHYSPSVMLYMKSQNDDMEISTAFVNMMNFGLNLQYRKIALGYESRWGNGKFKPISFSDEDGEAGSNKYTRRFSNNRLYVQFTF